MADRSCDWAFGEGPITHETAVGWLVRYSRDHLPYTREQRSRAAIAPLLGMTTTKLLRVEEGHRALTLREAARVVSVLRVTWDQLTEAARHDAYGTDPPLRPGQARTKFVTERELAVARLLSQGYSNVEIADEIGLKIPAVKYHVSRLIAKLGVFSRAQVGAAFREETGS